MESWGGGGGGGGGDRIDGVMEADTRAQRVGLDQSAGMCEL